MLFNMASILTNQGRFEQAISQYREIIKFAPGHSQARLNLALLLERSGVELEVDYGDLDPLSPEGVAKRETALAETAIESQMDYLEKNYPRAYKVLQHEANGGSVEDLFKPGFKDYSKIELEEAGRQLRETREQLEEIRSSSTWAILSKCSKIRQQLKSLVGLLRKESPDRARVPREISNP